MSELGQARAYRLSAIAIAGFLAALFVNVLDYYGPRIEGYFLPVAQSIKTELSPVSGEPNKLVLTGVMNKYRNCELISSVTYINDAAGNRVIARVETLSQIRLRPPEVGTSWGPWKVDIPVWARKAELNVITVHQCHPLWVTQTRFATTTIQ